jgi:hypothetical protein
MGGLNSTRWGGHRWRWTVEESRLPLHVSQLLPLVHQPHGTTARMSWEGARRASARVTVEDDAEPGRRRLFFEYSSAIGLTSRTPSPVLRRRTSGSPSRWIPCRCGSGASAGGFGAHSLGRRAALYLHHGARFQCRVCAGMAYRSQRLDAFGRVQLRTARIEARLGPTSGDWPTKPPRMRWKTYDRHIDALERADVAFMANVRRDLERSLINKRLQAATDAGVGGPAFAIARVPPFGGYEVAFGSGEPLSCCVDGKTPRS